MPANMLGSRRYYRYTDDLGNQFKYLTDADLGEAVGAVLDDTLPDLPRRFRPRGVYMQGAVAGVRVRKFLICPTAGNEIYAANVSQPVAVDGATLFSTGRRGERVTFGQNPTTTSA
jgi:hypothetical protein